MRDPLHDEITRLADGIAAPRIVRELIIRARGNPMDRLTEKLQRASGVAQRITEKIEARADLLIARETLIDERTEHVFGPHESVLTEAERGLDAAEAALRLLANSPLPSSPALATVPPKAAATGDAPLTAAAAPGDVAQQRIPTADWPGHHQGARPQTHAAAAPFPTPGAGNSAHGG